MEIVFATGWLGLGSTTYEFEEAIKKQVGCREAIAVSTGTAALHLALEGFGIGPGDEVIVPSLTFAASVQAIVAAGATPVFCDVAEDDLLITTEIVAPLITARTRGIMPIHYCGPAVDVASLVSLAEQHGAWVIEDAAHAFGSSSGGRPVGSIGHATCFSFDPIKIITCGEGGAIALHDPERAEEIRRRRLLGIDKDTWHRYKNRRSAVYDVTTRGYRYHMPNYSAAIGLAQLRRVDEVIARRRHICRAYDASWSKLTTVRPLAVEYDTSAPFIYILRVLGGKRERFMKFLAERGVESGIHYIPNHLHTFLPEISCFAATDWTRRTGSQKRL